MDSSVDVSDLMVELLCKGGCSDKECAESDGMDGGPWSHSKLMDCIRRHFRKHKKIFMECLTSCPHKYTHEEIMEGMCAEYCDTVVEAHQL